jgi:hypothetical protein
VEDEGDEGNEGDEGDEGDGEVNFLMPNALFPISYSLFPVYCKIL